MTTTYQDLYSSLGFLFYSIADSDGRVSPAEANKLKAIIKEQWLPLENSRDELGTDSGHYIDISFDFARDAGMKPDEAFGRFVEEFNADPERFDASMRKMIFDTAAAIASSSRGNSKSELTRLAQLEQLFKKGGK
ncbi:MAG: hypothetical protein IPP33_07555 [Flavobacteriales bacterium]|nr:hypothetical protein [Flavobacteriales bacterium]